MTPFLDTARSLWAAGLSPIPLGKAGAKSLGKLPKENNWQAYCATRASESRISEWLEKFPDSNVGLAMGYEVTPGWVIAGVDVDAPEHLDKVERAIGHLLSGKKGAKGATWFVLAPTEMKSRSFKLSKALNGGTLVDYLSHGKQTVVPPSLHPQTGEPYVWLGCPLTDLPGGLTSLPKINAGLMLEIAAIAAGKDQHFNGGVVGVEGQETEIEGINNMIWAGDGQGGTTHDSRLSCCGYMVATGWTEEDAIERLNRAMQEAWERGNTDEELDWDRVQRDHEKMYRGAVEKGFADKKEKTKKKANPPERTLAEWAASHYAPIVFADGKFRKYRDGHWPELRPEVIKKSMLELDLVFKVSDVSNAVSVMALMLDDPEFGKSNTDKICLTNGTLDVTSGILLQHDPEHQCMHQLDFDWDLDAKSPVYDEFVDWVFKGGEKEIAAWDEFAGLTLVPDLRYQKMMYLLGPGANGKSTLAYLLMSVHAADAVSTVPMTSLDDERQRTALVGSLVNVSTEQSRLNMMADAVFKQVTAGDPISTRRLYKEVENKVILTARLLGLANELPATNDTSFAMRRRMLILECVNIITDEKKDPDLIDKLKAERSAILRRWVEALRRLRERGKFDEPVSSTDAVEAYLREHDSVAQWLEARTIPAMHTEPGKWPTVEECYFEYNEFAKNMGYRAPFALPVFKAKLKNLGARVSRSTFSVGDVISIVEQVGISFKNQTQNAVATRV